KLTHVFLMDEYMSLLIRHHDGHSAARKRLWKKRSPHSEARPEERQPAQAGLLRGIGRCLHDAKQRNASPLLKLVEAEVRRDRCDEPEISARTRQSFDLGSEKVDNRCQLARRKPFHQVFIIDTVDDDMRCLTF